VNLIFSFQGSGLEFGVAFPAPAHTDGGAGGQPKSNLIMTHTRLYCRCQARWRSAQFDLVFVLFQTHINRSPAPASAEIYLASTTYNGDGGPIWCWWSAQIKPHHDAYEVVLSLPGEMTVSADINRSLFTITGSDLCFKHYIQYGGSFWVGGQPKLALITVHSSLRCCCYARRWRCASFFLYCKQNVRKKKRREKHKEAKDAK